MSDKIPVDKQKISERIEDIKVALVKLKVYKSIPEEKFTQKSDEFALASYWLRIALEATLTIATHILSRLPSNGKKKDYTQILISLGEYDVIPQEFSQKVKGMAGYRNRLVHLYWEVKPQELYKLLQKDLGDFEKFITYINKFLEKQ